MAGEAYSQKGDGPNAIVYGNRAIEADPKNFQALLLVSTGRVFRFPGGTDTST